MAAGVVLLLLGLGLRFDWIDWADLASWGRPRALWLAAFAAAAACAAAASRPWWPVRDRAERERAPGLSWWTVVAASVVVGAVAWGATSWLLAEADRASSADAKAAAKVDAIKTGLGIGAGTTGIFALLLAVRRQTYQERATADTTYDATERRVTELYTKAADQLGSPKAAVRLAGLYALERLGDDHESQRSTIINVICAYLRIHYAEPAKPDDTASFEQIGRYEDQVQEAQVRLTALSILHKHRTPTLGTFWPGHVNLDGANLAGADLGAAFGFGENLHVPDFRGAAFVGSNLSKANLTGVMFLGADLRDANLDGASCFRANFTTVNLGSTILRDADLREAEFIYANLKGADLSSANLFGARLKNAFLDGATVNDTTQLLLPERYELEGHLVVRRQGRE
ncbi:pentapeptide repeat-containing protein [Amycolatopsis sp. lyj-23]|uniref:pentapeptide repeat-containing protein n=1 Tax=Amycolatopsis sp. lyj-23 TaxID=2789283 RepID=UPI0039798976